jgi:hypothetical protein
LSEAKLSSGNHEISLAPLAGRGTVSRSDAG